MKNYDKLDVKLSVGVISLDFDEFGRETGDFYIKQEVYINNKLFTGTVDLSCLFKNTWLPTRDWMNTYYEEEYKQESLACGRSLKYSHAYLETCSCGNPGCAGIWNGVKIHKKKDAYCYTAHKKDGYKEGLLGTGKWVLWFSKENIQNLRNDIAKFYKDNKALCECEYESMFPLKDVNNYLRKSYE